jgi:hypothetical protein
METTTEIQDNNSLNGKRKIDESDEKMATVQSKDCYLYFRLLLQIIFSFNIITRI